VGVWLFCVGEEFGGVMFEPVGILKKGKRGKKEGVFLKS